MGWGGFLDKLLGKVPIQDRKERWKNQIDDLTKERKELLNAPCNEKRAARIADIDINIARLQQLFKNATSN